MLNVSARVFFARLCVISISATAALPAYAKYRPQPRPLMATTCEAELMKSKYFTRAFELKTPKWNDDMAMVSTQLEAGAWNYVRPFFSSRWDTEVYFTATGVPNSKMQIPLVDPDSLGVVLFLPGSGTAKTSGSNYVGNMSTLANLGYSAVSIDTPKHASGPLSEKYDDIEDFMRWMKMIVDDLRAFGKPVYLAGHSFGPEVIFEYISRYPNDLAGVLALSPTSVDRVTEEWYWSNTVYMKFGGDVPSNDLGGEWAEGIARQRTWDKGIRPDPTVVNPNLRVRMLSGNMEEYVPAPVGGKYNTPVGKNTHDISVPLLKLFSNASITIEDGIGHYLFDWRDKNGQHAVTREILLMLGQNPANVEGLAKAATARRQAHSITDQFVQKYLSDLTVQAWVNEIGGRGLMQSVWRRQDDDYTSTLQKKYALARTQRFTDLTLKVAETQQSDPEFYAQHKAAIEEAVAKNKLNDELITAYFRRQGGVPPTLN